MQKLINNIKQWGLDRGIDKCDPLLQTTKTLEECMELQRAIIRYEDMKKSIETGWSATQGLEELPPYLDKIKDAIGDIFITLVMIDLQINISLCEVIESISEAHNLENSFNWTLTLLSILKDYQLNLDYNSKSRHINIRGIVSILNNIAVTYNLSLKECVDYAYNQIKDRKGSIVDGLWEKEQ